MKKLLLSFVAVTFLFAITGCECSVSTANITDAKVCTTLDGNLCSQDNTTLPTSSEVIYASCVLKNAPENTIIKFTWSYLGDTTIEIDSVELSSGDNIGNIDMFSSLSRPNNGWPAGLYQVSMEIVGENGKPVVKQFNIQ
ncbi:hypothetical protein SDC9_123702 [bioreactor metagenome]|uniref:Ig-like domain-containing protein n=1 Tax=bioreactor metagenome TaxID=1076179 RepID=A0A645CID7_9ZZZZ|nr:hypothetical protein [Rikenellaceae bacterium]